MTVWSFFIVSIETNRQVLHMYHKVLPPLVMACFVSLETTLLASYALNGTVSLTLGAQKTTLPFQQPVRDLSGGITGQSPAQHTIELAGFILLR